MAARAASARTSEDSSRSRDFLASGSSQPSVRPSIDSGSTSTSTSSGGAGGRGSVAEPAMSESDLRLERRSKRGLLKMYYGVEEGGDASGGANAAAAPDTRSAPAAGSSSSSTGNGSASGAVRSGAGAGAGAGAAASASASAEPQRPPRRTARPDRPDPAANGAGAVGAGAGAGAGAVPPPLSSALHPREPLNIDGDSFDPKEYFHKILQEQSLPQLMNRDTAMIKELQTLDTDMQTLVYENYNKFISATDTIREMKSKVESMEDEMAKLAQNMSSITTASAEIHGSLGKKHEQIAKLTNVHLLLKKLQFLFELPARLKKCMELNAYGPAVQYYVKASGVLEQYKEMPSFRGIHADCQAIMTNVATKLHQRLNDKHTTPSLAIETIELLLDLGEPTGDLCDLYIAKSREALNADLARIASHVPPPPPAAAAPVQPSQQKGASTTATAAAATAAPVASPPPPSTSALPIPSPSWSAEFESATFVETLVVPFVRTLSEAIANFRTLFLSSDQNRRRKAIPQEREVLHRKLNEHSTDIFRQFIELVERRLGFEVTASNGVLLVQALDKIFAELMRLERSFSELHPRKIAAAIVRKTISARVAHCNRTLQGFLSSSLASLATAVADAAGRKAAAAAAAVAAPTLAAPTPTAVSESTSANSVPDAVSSNTASSAPSPTPASPTPAILTAAHLELRNGLLERLKLTMIELQAYTVSDFAATLENFRSEFETKSVRWEIIFNFFDSLCVTIADIVKQFSATAHLGNAPASGAPGTGSSVPHQAILVLCRLCIDLEASGVGTVVRIADELFPMSSANQKRTILPLDEMHKQLRTSSQQLIAAYVEAQGLLLSQMIRKSVETRDWLSTPEPRNVRPVMKRVVEDLTALDIEVGQLFEEERARSSESSRKAHSTTGRSMVSGSAASGPDRRFVSPTSFENSLMSNIQKLFSERIEIFGAVDFTKNSIVTGIFKITLKASARLRTFNKFGLQQIQVDTHYLRLNLWHLITDENLLNSLLDEVVTSTSTRCVEVVLMEHSVLDLICRRS
ncbi:hypothetical protein CAOG_001004 [Capsaspora owczarzaki ATCC 30864]|uniref:Exocyst complex component EXOC2/Sec5 N-terminal domain-containing protein n=1 Tax=Capsaspora owczarzaki (strain ATCC 30864) TaxID=595528 RepID=A0A0D2X0S3_CAPO3|nr:hypothetical protein CAOG_001004 [Capsaspora owczarzaki ATCC 30864]